MRSVLELNHQFWNHCMHNHQYKLRLAKHRLVVRRPYLVKQDLQLEQEP